MQTTLQDIRFAFRQFLRAPGFAVTVIVTLALGIGSATAVFSVIDATLLRPLPFAHQQRLVAPHTQAINGWNQPWSYPSYRDARAQLKTFDALAGYNLAGRINLEAPSGAVALAGVKTADNFFDVFGIKPLLGRTYLPGEDQPGKDDVAVLSYEVWQRDFGGQRDAVGKVVRLDGSPYTVIGVMPSGFRFPLEAVNAIYTPLHMTAQETTNRGSHWMFTVGLLQAGASEEQAQADLSHVFANLAKTYPDTDRLRQRGRPVAGKRGQARARDGAESGCRCRQVPHRAAGSHREPGLLGRRPCAGRAAGLPDAGGHAHLSG
jgi:putative ABC transport system permease protein